MKLRSMQSILKSWARSSLSRTDWSRPWINWRRKRRTWKSACGSKPRSASGAVAGPLRDGQADWHQFGWIQIAFVYGGETKGDTSQNAAAIRLNVRGYKDSQALASPGPSK